jgi:2-dehydropantoate 2-reductase
MELQATHLAIDGLCINPVRLSFGQLEGLGEPVDIETVMPGHKGFALKASVLIAKGRPKNIADFVTIHSTDGSFDASVPIAELREKGLFLYKLDGKPLPRELGGPVRLLIPGSTNPCANVKFVGRLEIRRGRGVDTIPKGDH